MGTSGKKFKLSSFNLDESESSEKKFMFTDLIDDILFNVYEHLDLQRLLLFRQASKKIKQSTDEYIKNRKYLLRLPPDLIYTDENIGKLEGHIHSALQLLGKLPEDCLFPINCNIFYSTIERDVKISPPLEALIAIKNSGVRISLNIMFDFQYDPSASDEEEDLGDNDLQTSYMVMLQEIFDNISNIESLKIDLEQHNIELLPQNWSADIFDKIEQLVSQDDSQLNSLSICKMNVVSSDLISCLNRIQQLSSFSMSQVDVFNLDEDLSDLGTEFSNVLLQKPLSELKLSNSSIDNFTFTRSILELLPYLTSEFLSKLETLDLSDNKVSFCNLHLIDYGDIDVPLLSMDFYRHLTNLKKLKLANNDINRECIEKIIPFIDSIRTLNIVDLSSNKIPTQIIAYMKDILPETLTLISVNNTELEQELLATLTPEDDGLTPDDDGLTPDDDGLTPDDDSLTPDENSLTPDENSLTPEDNYLTEYNRRYGIPILRADYGNDGSMVDILPEYNDSDNDSDNDSLD